MSNIAVEFVSILAGFIAIGINEYFTHKRDIKHKKEELVLSHSKEMLEWLSMMRQDIFKISRMLIASIGIYSDLDRKKQMQEDFKIEVNEIVERSIVFCNSYAEVNSSLGIDLELSELNKDIGQYVEKLRDILKTYPFPDKDNKDLNSVNEETAIIQGEIKKRISIISKEISNLLMK